ncbi:hypothetical protein DVH24_019566 [Malus domestica]|uniref:Uncharacterized protein n=1 Tax=Malus domestica TaxID=3750 RepID=A0A498HYH4_MALDO|nr:hypothetical protein DVH24_019566 [Malus domestica]
MLSLIVRGGAISFGKDNSLGHDLRPSILSDVKLNHQICAKDAVTGTGVDLINAVFTQKLGVFATENQLEEFFSQIP